MTQHKYTASKTRSSRPGWSVTFTHPLISNNRGEYGVKVRRGLNTRDDVEADRLVEQINQLLGDPSWWSLDRRADAEKHFDAKAVSAFYHGVEVGKVRSRDLRDQFIPLPTREEGYARVMLVGSTGAGKTTLLRQLIGSDPNRDRFPSTSASRTTTADIEIVTGCIDYTAVVTFMTEHETRCNVDECIEAACVNALRSFDDTRIAEALLEHREQRFRLSYPLGTWQEDDSEDEADDQYEMDDVFGETDTETLDEDEAVTEDEAERNRGRLREYVSRIKNLTESTRQAVAVERGDDYREMARGNQQRVWLEDFVDTLYSMEEFRRLSLDIIDDIHSRFALIDEGDFERNSKDGWPSLWYFEKEDRDEFLKQVRWFSSNHHKQYGRLLTPLVDGIRVSGQFSPKRAELRDAAEKLVLLDGEGLGHSAKEATSISTRVTEKFHETDMILLVDNAKNPMLPGPLQLLRSVGSSGHAHKLAVAFTHFDLIREHNLRSFTQKRNHVRASITNAIGSLRDLLGASVTDVLETRLNGNDFYLGALNVPTSRIPRGFIGQLSDLMCRMQKSAEPEEVVELGPIYSAARLELGLRDATDGFKGPWRGLLGLDYYEGVVKEHWGRVKALCRRIANRWDNDEYVYLKPKADLVRELQDVISRWLANPSGWNRQPENDDEREKSINEVRQRVFRDIHPLVEQRLVVHHTSDWREAFGFRGTGSSFDRARTMGRIYDEAAPSVSSTMDDRSQRFLDEVIDIVREAVEDVNGHVEMS